MKPILSQNQRILTAFLYLAILFYLFHAIGGNLNQMIWKPSQDSSVWFYAGALMIVLGAYLVEPFFTKPSDAIANAIAILIALFGITDKQHLVGFPFIFYYASAVLVLSVITIVFKNARNNNLQKLSKGIYWIVETFGASKVIFSIIYLAAAYSYFATTDHLISFISIIAFWICLTFFDVIGILVSRITRLIRYFKVKAMDELGIAIGCENPLLYMIEIDFSKHSSKPVKYGDLVAVETSINVGSIGMVVDIKYLLNKKWLSIYLIQDTSGEILKIDLKKKKLITEPKSIFSQENLVYLLALDELSPEAAEEVRQNALYSDREQFVGYVTSGSNINTINFSIVREMDKVKQKITEGAILKTPIYGQETLYQVINGNTREEHLENFDRHYYIVGIARKLGKYNYNSNDLDTSKWMPVTFSPLFFAFTGEVTLAKVKEIAGTAIGRLPETDLPIPLKDIDSIVTHNTAILGILGIGKSCLAYELIKKVADQNIKVVCIDITNEYQKELPAYLPGTNIITNDNENAFNSINTKYEHIHTEGTGPTLKEIPDKSGNIMEYKTEIHKDLCQFIFGTDSVPDNNQFEEIKKVRIYNLDYHKVSKGEKIGFKVITADLTQAEKTRIVSEELFKVLMKIPLSEEKKAKVLLVFEEAHSLIPEWNSVASEGDKVATNGTAKVILQGRKYGLGSLVITQRTANVSKSILNQCNTIFALRIFDDTGKGFLENYIGQEYANTLPTLEERHAIAIGKGLRLKQPVIIQLNDKTHIIPLSSNSIS